LAYSLEFHLRQRLGPLLFDDPATDKEAAEVSRSSLFAQAQLSPATVNKQTPGVMVDDRGDLQVHAFRSLLADLITRIRNTVVTAITPNLDLTILSWPTGI